MADCGPHAVTIVHSRRLWIAGHLIQPDLSGCGMPASDHAAWARLARAQHGVISRGQLSQCGQSPGQIAGLIRFQHTTERLAIKIAHSLQGAQRMESMINRRSSAVVSGFTIANRVHTRPACRVGVTNAKPSANAETDQRE